MEGRLLKPETAVYEPGPSYKWVALSNTTLGSLMASINMSSLIIALPVIFRGINLDPLAPTNFTYLLWVLIGYVLVTAVLVVTLGPKRTGTRGQPDLSDSRAVLGAGPRRRAG